MAWPKPDTKFTYIGQYLDTNGIFVNWTSANLLVQDAATTGDLRMTIATRVRASHSLLGRLSSEFRSLGYRSYY